MGGRGKVRIRSKHGGYLKRSIFIMLLATTSIFGMPREVKGTQHRTLRLVNDCNFRIWPGILSNEGWAAVGGGGFSLEMGESKEMWVPQGWSGRLWARTGCRAPFPESPLLRCATGDCGGLLSCSASGAALPVTLVELSLALLHSSASQLDFYDISVVDGFNLPVSVSPLSPSAASISSSSDPYACGIAACHADLTSGCPTELRALDDDRRVVGCRSACDAFKAAAYCCAGAYANAGACRPSAYARMFKSACPSAYSYAFDDPTSTFTCPAAAGGGATTMYAIVFCPSERSAKLGNVTRTNDSPYLNYNIQTIFPWLMITLIFSLH